MKLRRPTPPEANRTQWPGFEPARRVVARVGRLVGAPWWPAAVGTVLAGLTAFEVASRGDVRAMRPSSVVLMVMGVVAAVAIARAWPVVAAAVGTMTTLQILLGLGRVPVAVLAAHATVFYLFGLRRAPLLSVVAALPFLAIADMFPDAKPGDGQRHGQR